MRSFGKGDNLFRFCNLDPRGFHITFTDEEGNYLSRVSGFRNGNTVFLNELRYSVDGRYSNEDVRDWFIVLLKFVKLSIWNVLLWIFNSIIEEGK